MMSGVVVMVVPLLLLLLLPDCEEGEWLLVTLRSSAVLMYA
jgi:hypothetical protein